jgi:peptide/nickel transport system substrate-binding protein
VGRRRLIATIIACLVGGAVLVQAGSSTRGQEGGILRISFSPAAGLDSIDPALSFSQPGWSLLDATCARLFTYPDEEPPAGFRVQREVAESVKASDDLKTYTFKLRRGFRFSNGAPVRASAFAHAINRVLLSPYSPGIIHVQDIVGARDVMFGPATTARGVTAHGNTLVVRFSRPAPDFITRTTLPYFCAVPPGLPAPLDVIGKLDSAGPYYVAEYRDGERVVIRRNPYYGGERRVHLDGFNVNLRGGGPVDLLRSIDRGDADWGHMISGIFMDRTLDLVGKYGINQSPRFSIRPGLSLRVLAFNSSRPLFRNNPNLRRAINFALDRQALVATSGGPEVARVTDQYLPHGLPGFHDVAIYPPRGNLKRAMELARGHLRSRKAVIYTTGLNPLPIQAAQLVKQQLARIGLDVKVELIPEHITSVNYVEKLTARGAKWDMALVLWTPNIPDAHAYLNLLLDSHLFGGESLPRLRSKLASRELARAVRLPQGRMRDRVYADVDAALARDVAPMAPINVVHEATLVSDRVGCIVLRPVLDLAVACLKK